MGAGVKVLPTNQEATARQVGTMLSVPNPDDAARLERI